MKFNTAPHTGFAIFTPGTITLGENFVTFTLACNSSGLETLLLVRDNKSPKIVVIKTYPSEFIENIEFLVAK